ncbi:hypothetical protein BC830DRAFT_1120413 [Chytriomyces sp. MP71]|nr:hypothetical protein BC830DRAFT_1120413 [Chytriomyces sp. MP71]
MSSIQGRPRFTARQLLEFSARASEETLLDQPTVSPAPKLTARVLMQRDSTYDHPFYNEEKMVQYLGDALKDMSMLETGKADLETRNGAQASMTATLQGNSSLEGRRMTARQLLSLSTSDTSSFSGASLATTRLSSCTTENDELDIVVVGIEQSGKEYLEKTPIKFANIPQTVLTPREASFKVAVVSSEWFREFNQNQVFKSLHAFQAESYSNSLCHELIDESMTATGVAVAHTAKLLALMSERKFIFPKDIKACLSRYANERFMRITPRAAHVYRYFGILYGAMTTHDPWLFSISSLHKILKSQIEADGLILDFPKAPIVLAQVLECVLVMKGEEALMDLMRWEGFELALFWKRPMCQWDLEDWFEENGFDCLLDL